MTAPHIVDPAGLLSEALSEASPDLMRSLLQTMINALLSADADAVVGAEYGRPSASRTAQRNGYRHRDLDTRVGTVDVAVPKLRSGTYFPEWLLERRKRAESALITVVADCYLAGVSTRRMDKLVKTLGIDSLSKSQVSRMAADLDQLVEDFRHRPLNEAGPFTFVSADALTMKVTSGWYRIRVCAYSQSMTSDRKTVPELTWPRQAGPLTLHLPTAASVGQALTWRKSPEVTRWLLLTTVDPDAYMRDWLMEDDDDFAVAAFVGDELVGTGSLGVEDAMGQVHAGASIWRRAQGTLGYTIDPAHAGHGYGTHLARALLSIAFDDLGLHRVTAGCFADNIPSWRVMERIGMRREQHGIKDSWHAELGWVDGYTYGILREEWPTREK